MGLGDHLVADDKKHGAPCEGQAEWEHGRGQSHSVVAHEGAHHLDDACSKSAKKGLFGLKARRQHGGDGDQTFRDILQRDSAGDQQCCLDIPGAQTHPRRQSFREIMDCHGGHKQQ